MCSSHPSLPTEASHAPGPNDSPAPGGVCVCWPTAHLDFVLAVQLQSPPPGQSPAPLHLHPLLHFVDGCSCKRHHLCSGLDFHFVVFWRFAST
jgi:hypothetical protein